MLNAAYSPSQLARALSRVKAALDLPAKINRVDVKPSPDGMCIVTFVEERREAALGIDSVVVLTAEETRAWRLELHRIAAENAGGAAEGLP
jgi:hypothetical protein